MRRLARKRCIGSRDAVGLGSLRVGALQEGRQVLRQRGEARDAVLSAVTRLLGRR